MVDVIKYILYELKFLGTAPKIGKATNMTTLPASPDQKKPLFAWLKDVFVPQPDRDYFLRLASSIESSAPVRCTGCA
jgi:hypothetical protein